MLVIRWECVYCVALNYYLFFRPLSSWQHLTSDAEYFVGSCVLLMIWNETPCSACPWLPSNHHFKSGAGLQLRYNAISATNNQNCKTIPFCKLYLNRLKLMEGRCSLLFFPRESDFKCVQSQVQFSTLFQIFFTFIFFKALEISAKGRQLKWVSQKKANRTFSQCFNLSLLAKSDIILW